MVKKAVCLMSGGLDSCIMAYIAKKEGYEIYALSFNYGQRHNKEIDCTKDIATSDFPAIWMHPQLCIRSANISTRFSKVNLA